MRSKTVSLYPGCNNYSFLAAKAYIESLYCMLALDMHSSSHAASRTSRPRPVAYSKATLPTLVRFIRIAQAARTSFPRHTQAPGGADEHALAPASKDEQATTKLEQATTRVVSNPRHVSSHPTIPTVA